ncbi:MAG TPA: 4-(cytidine 5'-diphospho)-2-C-methyl-D-erythritol kinase [Candidatus Acidoferrum sp.]
MTEVRIPAFAKVNLRLDILGKRADGYHELRTIFQTLSLHDDIRLRASKRAGISLTIQGNTVLALQPVKENLVYRAVDAVKRNLKISAGVEIELKKTIPAGGGLGGGSSDAVAAMFGYLQLTEKKLATAEMLEIAASLGADVPFFLFGGRALGVNRGDELYPLQDIPKMHLLVVVPGEIRVPTADAFRWVNAKPLGLTKPAIDSKLLEFCALSWSAQGSGLSNDFERPVFQRHPRLGQIKRVLLQKGATEASLAGSGSAVFGIFPSPAMARRAAVGFPHDQTFVCETVSRDRYARRMRIAG